MRTIERISLFMEKIDFKKYLSNEFNKILSDEKQLEILKNFNDNKEKILNFWLENQDLRFSQILIKLNIISNYSGFWYYKEEYEILLEQNNLARDILFWGTYGKDGKQPLKHILIKDMNLEHLKNVLKMKKIIGSLYFETMLEEINIRRKLKLKKILE